jgi:hypothetical protein
MGIRRPYQAKGPIEWAKDHDLAYKTWITRHSNLKLFFEVQFTYIELQPHMGGKKKKRK